MPHYCSVCQEDFEREVGFYWGAMMISHALTTALSVAVHLIVFQFYGWEPMPFIGSFVTALLILFPIVFRVSRAVWINIFVDYEGLNLD